MQEMVNRQLNVAFASAGWYIPLALRKLHSPAPRMEAYGI